MMKKTTVLLVIDVDDWSFANIAKKVKSKLDSTGIYECKIVKYSSLGNEVCDIVIPFWYGSIPTIRRKVKYKLMISLIYDCSYWIKGAQFRNILESNIEYIDIIGVANDKISEMLNKEFATMKLPPIVNIEDGVDTTKFQLDEDNKVKELVFGWTGNSAHKCLGDNGESIGLKGLELIKEACAKADVKLITIDRADGKFIPHDKMVDDFYSKIRCYICASKWEGTPNPVLEAASCGLAIISTDVGLVDKIVFDGVNGYIVERSVDGIYQAIEKLKKNDYVAMGHISRTRALDHDWSIKISRWEEMLHMASEVLKSKSYITCTEEQLKDISFTNTEIATLSGLIKKSEDYKTDISNAHIQLGSLEIQILSLIESKDKLVKELREKTRNSSECNYELNKALNNCLKKRSIDINDKTLSNYVLNPNTMKFVRR